jgi:hypothetical protein
MRLRHLSACLLPPQVKEADLKLGRVVALDAGTVRERDWCNVITAHEGESTAFVWRLQHFTLGEHELRPPAPVAAHSTSSRYSVCVCACVACVCVCVCDHYLTEQAWAQAFCAYCCTPCLSRSVRDVTINMCRMCLYVCACSDGKFLSRRLDKDKHQCGNTRANTHTISSLSLSYSYSHTHTHTHISTFTNNMQHTHTQARAL